MGPKIYGAVQGVELRPAERDILGPARAEKRFLFFKR
jgi:hypothetical protein